MYNSISQSFILYKNNDANKLMFYLFLCKLITSFEKGSMGFVW
jgi:hypothetical protein